MRAEATRPRITASHPNASPRSTRPAPAMRSPDRSSPGCCVSRAVRSETRWSMPTAARRCPPKPSALRLRCPASTPSSNASSSRRLDGRKPAGTSSSRKPETRGREIHEGGFLETDLLLARLRVLRVSLFPLWRWTAPQSQERPRLARRARCRRRRWWRSRPRRQNTQATSTTRTTAANRIAPCPRCTHASSHSRFSAPT